MQNQISTSKSEGKIAKAVGKSLFAIRHRWQKLSPEGPDPGKLGRKIEKLENGVKEWTANYEFFKPMTPLGKENMFWQEIMNEPSSKPVPPLLSVVAMPGVVLLTAIVSVGAKIYVPIPKFVKDVLQSQLSELKKLQQKQ